MTDEELFQHCVCELGIAPFDYYDLSPKELQLIAEYIPKKKKRDYEMQRKVIMMAVACAMNGKDKPLFEEEKEQMKPISTEERSEIFELLEKAFGGDN